MWSTVLSPPTPIFLRNSWILNTSRKKTLGTCDVGMQHQNQLKILKWAWFCVLYTELCQNSMLGFVRVTFQLLLFKMQAVKIFCLLFCCWSSSFRQPNKIMAYLTFHKWLVLVCNIHNDIMNGANQNQSLGKSELRYYADNLQLLGWQHHLWFWMTMNRHTTLKGTCSDPQHVPPNFNQTFGGFGARSWVIFRKLYFMWEVACAKSV